MALVDNDGGRPVLGTGKGTERAGAKKRGAAAAKPEKKSSHGTTTGNGLGVDRQTEGSSKHVGWRAGRLRRRLYDHGSRRSRHSGHSSFAWS